MDQITEQELFFFFEFFLWFRLLISDILGHL